MRLPDIRERLVELSFEHDIPELRELAAEMVRRHSNRRAPTKSRRVTTFLALRIRLHARINQKASFQEIANHFGVNPGRVSEIINGKRA